MGAGLLSISAYSGGGPSYQLTVTSSAGVTIDDQVSEGAGKIYRATSIPDGTHINIEDDVEPDAPVGVPVTGNGAYWTPTTEHDLVQPPFSAPYWDAILRQVLRKIDTLLGAHGTAGGDLTGEYPNPEVQTIAKSLRFLGGLIAPTILSDQDDYSPSGLADTSILRVASDAPRTITGIATGANGRLLYVMNGGSYPITLAHEDSGSTAANRFYLENNADAVIAPNSGVELLYCGDSSRWRTPTPTNALRNGDTAGGDLTGTYPNPSVKQSSETVAGKIEIADIGETNVGADDTRAITPAKLAGSDWVKGRLVKHLPNQGTTLNPTTTDLIYTSAIPQMTETFTPANANNLIRVTFDCMFTNTNNDKRIYAAIFIDGSEQTGCEVGCTVVGTAPQTVSLERWFQLTAAPHTIEVRWKTDANTATAVDDNRNLLVQEYSAL